MIEIIPYSSIGAKHSKAISQRELNCVLNIGKHHGRIKRLPANAKCQAISPHPDSSIVSQERRVPKSDVKILHPLDWETNKLPIFVPVLRAEQFLPTASWIAIGPYTAIAAQCNDCKRRDFGLNDILKLWQH